MCKRQGASTPLTVALLAPTLYLSQLQVGRNVRRHKASFLLHTGPIPQECEYHLTAAQPGEELGYPQLEKLSFWLQRTIFKCPMERILPEPAPGISPLPEAARGAQEPRESTDAGRSLVGNFFATLEWQYLGM